MTRSHNHMVKAFDGLTVGDTISGGDNEATFCRIKAHVANIRAEPDIFANIRLFHTPNDIVKQHRSWWKAGYWLAKMLFERVIGKFQTLFWTVGPQIAIHRPMTGVSMLINPGAPCVIPQSAPI